jgi:type IV secretion system protein VirD4
MVMVSTRAAHSNAFDLSRTLATTKRGVRELFQELLDTDHAAFW